MCRISHPLKALEAGLLSALLPLLELVSSTTKTSNASSSSTDAHKAAFVRVFGSTTVSGASSPTSSGESPLTTPDATSALVLGVQGVVLAAETLQLGVSSNSSSGDGSSGRGGAHSAALALHTLHTAVTVQLRPDAAAACSVRRQKVRLCIVLTPYHYYKTSRSVAIIWHVLGVVPESCSLRSSY
jgi:hypothetical protein